MLRLAVVFALALGVLAGGSGCFFQEEFACVGGGSVRCGDDWCSGDCTLTYKKTCDKKVSYKLDCDLVDFCKEIKKPCGDDGLYCGASEECVATEKCKLVKAHEAKPWFKGGRKVGGFIEVCEDVYTCAAVDPWALDAEAIEVVCKKEYEIVEDMDCDALFAKKSLWGGIAIGKKKFFKMNGAFKCEDKLVGKLVCIEAEATIKAETCSNGIVCDSGYKCATKKECTKVPTVKPVCGKEPVYVCDASSSGASLCGNKVCSASQSCEIVTTKVCPGGVVLPVPIPGHPGTIIPGQPGIVIPGKPGVVIPGQPGVVIPGQPGVVIPEQPGVVIPVQPGTAVPQPLIVNGEQVPAVSVASSSFADDTQTTTSTDAVSNGGIGSATAEAVNGDGSFADSSSIVDRNALVTTVDANSAAGDGSTAIADGAINRISGGEATQVAGVQSDVDATDSAVFSTIDATSTRGEAEVNAVSFVTNAGDSQAGGSVLINDVDGANAATFGDTLAAGQVADSIAFGALD